MASESIPRRRGMKTTRLLALNEGGSAMCGIILEIKNGAIAGSGTTVQLPVQFSGVHTTAFLFQQVDEIFDLRCLA